MALFLALLACGCPSARPDGRPDADDISAEDAESTPTDDSSGTDGEADSFDADIGLDATDEDAVGDAGDCEYLGVQVECDPWTPDYEPPPGWEPPVVDCGPGCRQVSWGAYRFSVWDRRAVMMRDRRILALNLDTLEHQPLYCEHAPIEVPRVGAVWPDLVAALSISAGGESTVYSRDLTVPGEVGCDDVAEFRLADQTLGSDRLLVEFRAPSEPLPGAGCSGLDVDQLEAFGTRGAFVMRDADCWTYLFALDLTTGAVRRYDGSPGGLFISNVWEDQVALATPGEVYLVDLDTGVRTNLSDDPADQTLPALHEHRVAWEEFRHAAAGFGHSPVFDVYVHDLATGEDRRVTSDTTARYPPRIFGNAVVWSDVRAAPDPTARYPEADVWMRDLVSGEERQVTALPGTEYEVQLWGNLVYFRWRPPGVIRTMDEGLCECPVPGVPAPP